MGESSAFFKILLKNPYFSYFKAIHFLNFFRLDHKNTHIFIYKSHE